MTGTLIAAVNARRREEAYRLYVADALYALCAFAGNPLRARLRDVLYPPGTRPIDGTQTAISRLENMGIRVVS